MSISIVKGEKMIKKYLNIILLIVIIILLIIAYFIFGYLYFFDSNNLLENNLSITNENVLSNEININDKSTFFVEVKGAVNSPGVYEMNSDNIINDLINVAGGFKNNAYTNNINLSKNVFSQMIVYVYTKYEYTNLNKKNDIVECNCPTYDITKCIDEGKSVINSNNDVVEENNNIINEEINNKENSNIININNASLSELMNLPGIGEAKANSIIEYREKNGLFNEVEDIKNVSGISEKIFESIKEYITI